MKWLKELNHYCPEAIKILVGTKIDLRDDPVIKQNESKILTKEDGIKLANEIKAQFYHECSSFTREGLKELFQSAARSVISSKNAPVQQTKKKGCFIL